MSGVLPKTAYLLVSNGIVVREFENLSSITFHLGISINDKGIITFMSKPVNPSYSLEYSLQSGRDGFTKSNAIKDWSRCYLYKHLPSQYKIYRYLL